jgi:hypothetical protein
MTLALWSCATAANRIVSIVCQAKGSAMEDFYQNGVKNHVIRRWDFGARLADV